MVHFGLVFSTKPINRSFVFITLIPFNSSDFQSVHDFGHILAYLVGGIVHAVRNSYCHYPVGMPVVIVGRAATRQAGFRKYTSQISSLI